MKKRINKLIAEFGFLNSWEEKYEYIIQLGQELSVLKKELKIDANLISGCQSKVWLYCEIKNKKLYFYADSDALITKGLVALIVLAYSNSSATEIINEGADFFSAIGLRKHLSMSRSNGLNLMLEKAQKYATKYLNYEK